MNEQDEEERKECWWVLEWVDSGWVSHDPIENETI